MPRLRYMFLYCARKQATLIQWETACELILYLWAEFCEKIVSNCLVTVMTAELAAFAPGTLDSMQTTFTCSYKWNCYWNIKICTFSSFDDLLKCFKHSQYVFFFIIHKPMYFLSNCSNHSIYPWQFFCFCCNVASSSKPFYGHVCRTLINHSEHIKTPRFRSVASRVINFVWYPGRKWHRNGNVVQDILEGVKWLQLTARGPMQAVPNFKYFLQRFKDSLRCSSIRWVKSGRHCWYKTSQK